MRSPRKWFFSLAVVSAFSAVASFAIGVAGQGQIYRMTLLVLSDPTKYNALSQRQLIQLADDIALYMRPLYLGQASVPVGLFALLTALLLFAGIRCPRTIAHATTRVSADAAA